MVLERRREPEVIPQYSLTGDLISFLRCSLQYRYHNGSSLPPSRPVQLWFGEFLHGVMEAAYRIWDAAAVKPPFPWPCTPTPYRQDPPSGRAPHDLGEIGDRVENTLRSQGKNPRSANARDSAYSRVELAVNELGPHLFPLIEAAEEPVIGTRPLNPPSARAAQYELHGIIDVLTDIQLSGAASSNVLRQAITDACPGVSGHFEVIVDYKGSRRPATTHPYWAQGAWQLQTYAWLRTRQPNSLPVVAGVLLYVNELSPSQEGLLDLRREASSGETDIAPATGSPDYYLLHTWKRGDPIPSFSLDFRFRRAIRVVPIDPSSQSVATTQFDQVVRAIEGCACNEAVHGTILQHWAPCGDEDTCSACDFRHFCPDPAPRSGAGPQPLTAPHPP